MYQGADSMFKQKW